MTNTLETLEKREAETLEHVQIPAGIKDSTKTELHRKAKARALG